MVQEEATRLTNEDGQSHQVDNPDQIQRCFLQLSLVLNCHCLCGCVLLRCAQVIFCDAYEELHETRNKFLNEGSAAFSKSLNNEQEAGGTVVVSGGKSLVHENGAAVIEGRENVRLAGGVHNQQLPEQGAQRGRNLQIVRRKGGRQSSFG